MNIRSDTRLHDDKHHSRFSLELTIDELAAVEGWRTANNLPSIPHAVRELIRLGLLSEVAKIHSVVRSIRDAVHAEAGGD